MDIIEAICIAVLIGFAIGAAGVGVAAALGKLLKRQRQKLTFVDGPCIHDAEPYPRFEA
ncbi:hypothetical protein [Paraburkholderia sp.]|uniref:hypothetical protein n=1 Tax=Paraburkholderia sp. TaxID=1926495 RepID=UPI00286FA686|nr:hypothetical protein [Paraburkholderia sp.]